MKRNKLSPFTAAKETFCRAIDSVNRFSSFWTGVIDNNLGRIAQRRHHSSLLKDNEVLIKQMEDENSNMDFELQEAKAEREEWLADQLKMEFGQNPPSSEERKAFRLWLIRELREDLSTLA